MVTTVIQSGGTFKVESGAQVNMGPPSAPPLPQQGSIIHHYDTTDLSTLWQDTGGTVAVTDNGDSILRMDDKGSKGDNLTEVSSFQAPVWNASKGAADFLGPGRNLNNANISDSAGDAPGLVISVAWLGYEIAAWQNATVVIGWWDKISTMAFRNDQNGSGSDNYGPYMFATGQTLLSTMPDTLDKSHSIIGWCDAVTITQKIWSSLEANPIDQAKDRAFPRDNKEFIYGANSNTGSLGINGRMREVIIWDQYQLTDDDVAAIQAYDTFKHGTVWET